MPWLIGGLVLLAVVAISRQGTVAQAMPPKPSSMSTVPVSFLGKPLAVPVLPIRRASAAPVNPNVVRLEGGTRFAEAQPAGTPNVLFQSGRDPIEAQQPVSIIVTDNSGSLATIDQALTASLPGGTTRARLPSVSLGPTVGQQAQGLINFYTGGVDAAGNTGTQTGRVEHFV